MNKCPWVAIIICLFLNSLAFAAGDAGTERNNQPIKIKSNELSTDNNNKTATFTGKVIARQGDLTIHADKLVISYSADKNDVEKAEAFGNVRILQGNRQGEAGHAVYDNKGGRITLDNAPKVLQGEDVVTGKVIIYYLNEQKSVVTGGDGVRVNAVINPVNKGKDGSSKP